MNVKTSKWVFEKLDSEELNKEKLKIWLKNLKTNDLKYCTWPWIDIKTLSKETSLSIKTINSLNWEKEINELLNQNKNWDWSDMSQSIKSFISNKYWIWKKAIELNETSWTDLFIDMNDNWIDDKSEVWPIIVPEKKLTFSEKFKKMLGLEISNNLIRNEFVGVYNPNIGITQKVFDYLSDIGYIFSYKNWDFYDVYKHKDYDEYILIKNSERFGIIQYHNSSGDEVFVTDRIISHKSLNWKWFSLIKTKNQFWNPIDIFINDSNWKVIYTFDDELPSLNSISFDKNEKILWFNWEINPWVLYIDNWQKQIYSMYNSFTQEFEKISNFKSSPAPILPIFQIKIDWVETDKGYLSHIETYWQKFWNSAKQKYLKYLSGASSLDGYIDSEYNYAEISIEYWNLNYNIFKFTYNTSSNSNYNIHKKTIKEVEDRTFRISKNTLSILWAKDKYLQEYEQDINEFYKHFVYVCNFNHKDWKRKGYYALKINSHERTLWNYSMRQFMFWEDELSKEELYKEIDKRMTNPENVKKMLTLIWI